MTTIFTWAVTNLERHTANGIVFTCHYTVAAKNNIYSSSAYGSIGLEQPDPENIIPYSDLTEEIVIDWVKDKLTAEKVAEIEAALQKQLDEQHSPSVAAGVPWA